MPSRTLSFLAAALVASIPWAACLDTGDQTSASKGFEDEPIDPDLAQLVGVVVDEELRAVDANVSLPSLRRNATTDSDGRFRLINLEPGMHELGVLALGFEPLLRLVDLRAGETTELTLTLRALPANGSYHESYPYVGLQPCQWYFEGTIAHCTLPYTQAHGAARQNGVNLSQYGAPRDLQDNRDRFNFSLRPDHTGVVSELYWKASSLGAVYQVLVIMCPWYDPVWDECIPPGSPPNTFGVRYFAKVGTNPISMTWKHPTPKHLLMAPYVWARANVNGADDRPLGLAIDQKIEFYNTVFYGQDPPEGFSAGPVG